MPTNFKPKSRRDDTLEKLQKAKRILTTYRKVIVEKPYGVTYEFAKYWPERLLKINLLITDLKQITTKP